MLANIGIDAAVGAIPLARDVFDVVAVTMLLLSVGAIVLALMLFHAILRLFTG